VRMRDSRRVCVPKIIHWAMSTALRNHGPKAEIPVPAGYSLAPSSQHPGATVVKPALIISKFIQFGHLTKRLRGRPSCSGLVSPSDPLCLNTCQVHRYRGGRPTLRRGDPLDRPLVSPSVGRLTELPRVTVFTGTHDVLNSYARAFHRRAQAQGVEMGRHEFDGGIHGWMCLPVGRNARGATDEIRRLLGS
jgi:hypothetical protein